MIHWIVTASFRVNLRRMEEKEKDFFASLGACGSTSFSYETARVVSDLPSSSMNRYLSNLMNLSLVSRATESLNGGDYTKDRYTVHTLVHEFCQALLEERNLKSQAKWNHGSYYSNRIRTADLDDGNVLSELDDDIEDIWAAIEWTCHQDASYFDVLLLLEDFIKQNDYHHKAAKVIESLLPMLDVNQVDSAHVELMALQVECMHYEDQWQLATDKLEEIATVIDAMDEGREKQIGKAEYLRAQSSLFQYKRQLSQAEIKLRESHKILKLLGQEFLYRQARILNKLGAVLRAQRRFDAATDVLQESREIFVALGRQRGLGKVLSSLGLVLFQQGKYDQAQTILEEGEKTFEQLSDEKK